MARRGRKRKDGQREPNGRIKRPTLAQIAAAHRSAQDAEKVVVLMQPHRRGDTSELCGSALGRFILARNLRREYYDAATTYAALKSKWLAAVGAPRDVRMGGSGADIDMAVVRAWAARIGDMELAMMRMGVAALGWVEELSVYDRGEPEGYQAWLAERGLMALAVHCGFIPNRVLTD